MYFKRRRLFNLVCGGGIDEIAEIEFAVAFRAPTGVKAIDIAAPDPENRDGAYHLDAPWINDALDLDDFMGASPHEYVELGLAGLGKRGGRVQPVAEGAGPVAAQVDSGQGHAALAHQIVRHKQKLVVENFGNGAAQGTVTLAVSGEIQHIVELYGAADKHVAFTVNEGFTGIELQLQAALDVFLEFFCIQQHVRSLAAESVAVLICEAVLILQDRQGFQAERQGHQRKGGKTVGSIFKISDQKIGQRQGRQSDRILTVVEDLHRPAVVGVIIGARWRVPGHLGRGQIQQRLPGDLGHGKHFYILPLADDFHALCLDGKCSAGCPHRNMGGHQPVATGKQIKADAKQVGIGTDVEQSKDIAAQPAGRLVPLALIIRQRFAAAVNGGSGCAGGG